MKLFKASVCVAVLASLSGIAGHVQAGSSSTAAQTATAQTYVVLYKTQAVGSDAAAVVSKAGGSLVASYPQIGVVIATSSSSTFRANIMQNSKIQGAAATGRFAVGLGEDVAADDTSAPLPDSLPATDTDSLSGLQWDMAQIHAPEAHAITGGSPSVLVGDIDTGLDYTHPDLAPNVDDANSVELRQRRVPDKVGARRTTTATARTRPARSRPPSNGIGIVGVAPNVKIAGIKAGNADGFFFPEAVVCAFMWAGTHHMQRHEQQLLRRPVAVQLPQRRRAAGDLERRAPGDQLSPVNRACVVVAAVGNQADDLAHPTQDATSPDDTTPVLATSPTPAPSCPTEVPGVVGVTANGNTG